MKKVISLILTVSVILSSLAICVRALDEKYDLEFAVASDLHYNAPREKLEGSIDDPVFWYANRRAAMEDESGFIIDEFLHQCAEDRNCNYVLIAGDLADNGRSRPEDHRAVAEKLRRFERETGKDVFVINGNHDASVDRDTTYELFKEIYFDFGYDKALTKPRNDCSYAADLGEKYRLIALDSNHPTKSTEDGIDNEKLAWVKEQVRSAKADGRYPILMMHHNLIDHMPMQRILSRNFIVKNHFMTAEFLADMGIKLVLSGHEHCGDGAKYTSTLGNVIYDFAITSLTMYPLAYEYFRLNDETINYERKNIDKIDFSALTSTVGGYTDEQISLMKADLGKYSKDFLKASVKYRLELGFTDEKLGLDKDKAYYTVARTAVDGFVGLLDMPLYGENSLSSLALGYGIELPVTQYANGWDLATDLVAMHYDGGEEYTLDSDVIQLFLRAVVAILRNDTAVTANELTLVKAANKLLGRDCLPDDITKLCIETLGTCSAAEYLIMAVASPLIFKFVNDNDGVDDKSGTLPGYGTVNVKNNLSNISANVSDLVSRLDCYIGQVTSYLLKACKVLLNIIKIG